MLNYYPDDISCLDKELESLSLRNGISQYWDAKYIQSFSRIELSMAAYDSNLNRMPLVTSARVFRETYDFAVISTDATEGYRLPVSLLDRINGSPKHIVHCGRLILYLYKSNSLRVTKISRIDDSFLWFACELPNGVGREVENCHVAKDDNRVEGHLTFGPYEKLPAGTYEFELFLSSSPSSTITVGAWDVALTLHNEISILSQGEISGTSGMLSRISGSFRIPANLSDGKVEVRTFTKSGFDMKLSTLMIKRVG